LLAALPIHAVTAPIALRAGQMDGENQAKGIRLSLADLLIGVTALELGYGVATANLGLSAHPQLVRHRNLGLRPSLQAASLPLPSRPFATCRSDLSGLRYKVCEAQLYRNAGWRARCSLASSQDRIRMRDRCRNRCFNSSVFVQRSDSEECIRLRCRSGHI
jgi:hypothetical protein